MKTILMILALVSIALAACTTQTTIQAATAGQQEIQGEKGGGGMDDGTKDSMSGTTDDSMGDGTRDDMEAGMGGREDDARSEILAGTTTPYKTFSQEEYEKALMENKKVFLYFYADWCPTCRAEQRDVHAAFEELKDPELVGFRVNFNDDMTDDSEKGLAEEFGIVYQHTKVLIIDGERVLKAPDTWDKERYLEELRN